MKSLPDLARKTAEKVLNIVDKEMLSELTTIAILKGESTPHQDIEAVILSCIQEAVEEKDSVIIFLRDRLDSNKCFQQPCSCEDCVDITNDLNLAEQMLATGSRPPKEIPQDDFRIQGFRMDWKRAKELYKKLVEKYPDIED